MNFKGQIQSIFGPMFSGKTSELIRKIKRYNLAKKKCLVINFSKDNRYSSENKICSHDLVSIPAIKTHYLKDISSSFIADKQVIGIDEGQFFDDIVEMSQKWANEGKIVIVAALDSSFKMQPFKKVTELLAISEFVQKLSAVCMECGNDAAFTKRIIEEDSLELVGGIDSYKPVCRKCFFTKN